MNDEYRTVACGQCGERIEYANDLALDRIECPSCSSVLEIVREQKKQSAPFQLPVQKMAAPPPIVKAMDVPDGGVARGFAAATIGLGVVAGGVALLESVATGIGIVVGMGLASVSLFIVAELRELRADTIIIHRRIQNGVKI